MGLPITQWLRAAAAFRSLQAFWEAVHSPNWPLGPLGPVCGQAAGEPGRCFLLTVQAWKAWGLCGVPGAPCWALCLVWGGV